MDIIIQSLGFTAGAELEEYIKEKLDKINRMDDNIIRARVTLQKGQEAIDNHHCDIRLEIPGNDLYVKKSAGSYRSASLETIEALQKIIRRSKD